MRTLNWRRASQNRRRAKTRTRNIALVTTATLGGVTAAGYILRGRNLELPWTKRGMAEVHLG